MAGNIKAIFWDNDGVLVDSELRFYEVTREVLFSAGVRLTPEVYVENVLKHGGDLNEILLGTEFTASEIQRLRLRRNERYLKLLPQYDSLEMCGVREMLKALRGRFRHSIVTGSLRNEFEIMHRRTGILEYMDFSVVREQYERGKPRPDGYLIALERAGLEPHQCLAIEDSQSGLTAAREAGLACWVIESRFAEGQDFSGAERVLSSISDIPGELGVMAA